MKAGVHSKPKGTLLRRVFSTLLLFPAWFAPHTTIRVFFHRLRGVQIGKRVEIGYFCIIGNIYPELIEIGDGAVIAAKATILEHDYSFNYSCGGPIIIGKVRIGEKAFIGINAVVLPNISIGESAIVAANSLVNRNVPPRQIAVGVPAVCKESIRKHGADQNTQR